MTDQVIATYWVETPLSIEQAAESLAGEQSTGTFVKVPGETEALKQRHAARVISIERLEASATASLPGSCATDGSSFQRAIVRIGFPAENFGSNLPTLVATLMGNLFELREVSGLKLLDLQFVDDLAAHHPGPQFGIAGTRQLTGVFDRPLIGTIVKPSIGLSPQQTAELVAQLADAGIDFIKDDELMANPAHSPFEQRVAAVMRVLNDAADRHGRKVMYAFNISDDWEAMKRNHDTVLQHGGTCVMVSLNSVGLVGVRALREISHLPVHGHRNGWGMYTRCPSLGIAFPAYQKLWRLAGIDHIHVNGLANKFWEPDDSVVQSIQACLTPLFSGYQVMPVVSSGQWGGQAPETYRRCQTVDLIYLAGGGMMAHPDGATSGCRAIRQAWEAAVAGVSLQDYAAEHTELRRSIQKFGARSETT